MLKEAKILGYLGRDVEVVDLDPQQCLVISCDSCGAIGQKEFDRVTVTWSITGRLTARVALMEVLAAGAVPKAITVAISNEPNPTGEETLKGVKEELAAAGLTLPMAVSTEKNIPTLQTGLGISVIGTALKSQLRVGTLMTGDQIVCFGLPKVGPEISDPEDSEIVHTGHLRSLLEVQGIHDIIPVGSRGIRAEALQLASAAGCRLIIEPSCTLDLDKSAGPSTCLLVSASPQTDLERLSESFKPLFINKVGDIL